MKAKPNGSLGLGTVAGGKPGRFVAFQQWRDGELGDGQVPDARRAQRPRFKR